MRALRSLSIRVGGEPVVFSRKLLRKPLALLKCLVAQGGKAVPTQRLVHAVLARGRALEAQGWHTDARLLYQRAFDMDGLSETFHQGLIRCLLEEGRVTDALTAYRRLRQVLALTLGRNPSRDTDALMARAQQSGVG